MTAINQDVGVDAPFVQGDTLTLQIPVFEADGTTPTDLSAASAIRWEVQRLIGGVPVVVDPPLIVKELGSGITIGDSGGELHGRDRLRRQRGARRHLPPRGRGDVRHRRAQHGPDGAVGNPEGRGQARGLITPWRARGRACTPRADRVAVEVKP